MLLVVRALFEVDRPQPGWLEDELVRRGARGAHMTEDGAVSILLQAKSRGEASELARDLLARVGATVLEVGSGRSPSSGSPVAIAR